jgi:Ca2+-transporting ATPase
LGTEKKEPGLMSDPPRDPAEPIINRGMIINIAVQAVVMTAAVLFAFWLGCERGGGMASALGLLTGRTYAFVTIISCELLRAYTARSERYSLFRIGVFSNRNMNMATILSFALLFVVMLVPALRDVFNVVKLDFNDWDVIALIAFLPLIFGELTKVVKGALARGKQ